MDSAQEVRSNGREKTHLESTISQDDKPDTEKEMSCSSTSSSSEDSSEEDFFQLDTTVLANSIPGNSAIATVTLGLPQTGDKPETTSESTSIGEVQSSSPGGASAVGSLIDDLSIFTPRQTADNVSVPELQQSPSVQVMTRSDAPDPNRIPSTVFTRTKSTTPVDWSVASNESLFSINVGNSSFSRDHVFPFGKSGDLTNFPSPPEPVLPISPPIPEETSLAPVGQPGAASGGPDTTRDVSRENAGHVDSEKDTDECTTHSQSLSRHSDGSTTSFAFPILTGERRSESLNVSDLPQQNSEQSPVAQPTTEAPKAAPAAAENRWFPWCSRCSLCC